MIARTGCRARVLTVAGILVGIVGLGSAAAVTFGVNTHDASTLIGTMGNTGTVNLGGTLDIATVGSPPVGSTFNVVGNNNVGAWTQVSGTFSSLDYGTESCTISYGTNKVTVTVATSP